MKTIRILMTILLTLSLAVGTAQADVPLPYNGSVSTAGIAFGVSNNYAGTGRSYGGYFLAASAEGRGVYGCSTGTVPDVNSYGGFFYAAGPKGRGVLGQSAGGQEGIGVKGWASNTGDVQNFGGHFRAEGLQGIGVYGWGHSSADTTNYGGFFQADGNRGIGVYATGGPAGYAGQFAGDLKITGEGKGIVFPDGTRLTTAAGATSTTPTSPPPSGGGTVAGGHPAPSYNSGWVQISATGDRSKVLTHNLGGNVDDYVVDLQLKYTDYATGKTYVTNNGIGDYQLYYYDKLTPATVTLVQPEHYGWLRVRIWVCPSQ